MNESLDELKGAIEALERELLDAREVLLETESTFERLDDARNEAAGELHLARRAVQDYEARLEERRSRVADSLRALHDEAVAERDAAVAQVAEAIRALLAALEVLDAARAALAAAESEADRIGSDVRLGAPPEPAWPAEEWERLHEVLSATSQTRLEEEMIAAAMDAPSPAFTIKKLPEHLQEVALRRHRSALRRREAER